MAETVRGRRGLMKAESTSVEIRPVPLPELEDLAPDLINPADNREQGDKRFSVVAQNFWASLMTHPTTVVLTEAQGLLLYAALCAYDSGLKGKTSALTESRRILDSFGITPEAIAKRRIDLVAAADAEDRLHARQNRSATTPSPKTATPPPFIPADLSEGE